jgi:hypothetical protein
MVQLVIQASDGHELFMILLCLDASFAMTPRASSLSCRNSNRSLRPKPKNCSPILLWPKPPNCVEKSIHYGSSTILTCVTVIHDHPITKASCASAWHGKHSLLLLMCSCWLMSPGVSHHGQSSGHFGPSSKPRVHPSPFSIHGTTHLYLTFSITVDHLYAPHLTTTQLTFRRSPKMPLVSAISASGTIPTGTKSPSPMALLSGAVERDVWCHRPGLQLLSWSVAPIRTIGLALVPVSVTNRD